MEISGRRWLVLVAVFALACDGTPPPDRMGVDSAVLDGGAPADGGPVTVDAGPGPMDAGTDAEPLDTGMDAAVADSGDGEWTWVRRWPGTVFEPTETVPSGRVELPIPGGATVRRLQVSYSVEIGAVDPGKRHQFDFTCADVRHPYRGGLFGFLFLVGQLGRYTFRNGRPGEGATDPTKIAFRGAPSTSVQVALSWDATAGTAVMRVTDDAGGVAMATSTDKVEPMLVPRAVTVIFGYDPIAQPNPMEAASLGWRYHDLTVRASP